MSDKHYVSGEGVLGAVLRTLPGKLASHWLFQGMAYMDTTERRFKLGLDAMLTIAIAAPLRVLGLPVAGTAAAALLLAHSLNFVFNGQLRTVLKWHGIGGLPRSRLDVELLSIGQRLMVNPGIKDVLVFGSVSRGEIHDGSDLDIRVMRHPGLEAALAACVAVLLERTRALLSGVPLDVYICDSEVHLQRMRVDEPPIRMRALVQLQSTAPDGTR